MKEVVEDDAVNVLHPARSQARAHLSEQCVFPSVLWCVVVRWKEYSSYLKPLTGLLFGERERESVLLSFLKVK